MMTEGSKTIPRGTDDVVITAAQFEEKMDLADSLAASAERRRIVAWLRSHEEEILEWAAEAIECGDHEP